MGSKEQTTSEGQPAGFICDSCGAELPSENVGKMNERGKPLCIPCSLKATSASATATTKESVEEHKSRVDASAEKREKEKGSRRWMTALLLIAIPIIGLEMFLLLQNRPAALTVSEAAEIEMAESIILIEILGQYFDEHGRYPAHLDALVPEFWSAAETDELRRYEYTRIGADNFRLNKVDSALPTNLISEALSRDLLPATMTAETNADEDFDPDEDFDLIDEED